jgi:hypothetical protein
MSKRQRLTDVSDSSDTDTDTDTDSSSDEEEQVSNKPYGLFKLPFEILSNIFILSSNTELTIVNQFLFHQLYYSHDSLKINFLMHKCHGDITKIFEEAVKYPFFNLELLKRLDTIQATQLSYKDKKIPARLFLQEPTETLEERDTIVLELLNRGACPNRPKGYPLIKSAQLGRLDRVKLLMGYGADPTIRNNMALRVCAARNNREMVDYFLDDCKVKPDSETLKACVQKNLWEMIQVLVDHGAVPDMSTIGLT